MKRMNRQIKAWHAFLRECGCIICGMETNIHHVRSGSIAANGIQVGRGQKASDWLVLPLCHTHHQGARGIHQIGVKTWEAEYGEQIELLYALSLATNIDIWTAAAIAEPETIDGEAHWLVLLINMIDYKKDTCGSFANLLKLNPPMRLENEKNM